MHTMPLAGREYPCRWHTHLGARLCADCCVRGVSQRVNADGQCTLGCQHAADLSLVLGLGLADEAGVVDETILGCLVLGLQRPVVAMK